MELHIKERILIANIFPEKGNFSEYTMKKNILKKIAITEQDKKDYNIVEKTEENRVEWDVKKDAEIPLSVDFSSEELKFMHKCCENISEKELPDEMWDVVEHIFDESQQ